MSAKRRLRRVKSDWREQLRKNERRTKWVMATFIIIYLSVGLLVDYFVYSTLYTNIPPQQIINAILRFYITPYATLIMGGIAVVSILITFALYDKIMLLGTDSRQITAENARNLKEKQLFNVVEEMTVAAGMRYVPKVFIINANYMNAFASGYSEKSAMVAITQGLLQKLDRAELQAVMAHELSHIQHQDIKLNLSVAVLSNIMLVVLDYLFYAVLYRGGRGRDNRLVIIVYLLRFILPLITTMLMLFLSRTREYMADAGSVKLMRDNEPLAKALLKIHDDHLHHIDEYKQAYNHTAHEELRRASYIYDPIKSGIESALSFDGLFSTHPKLSDRLQAIGFKTPPA